MTQPRSGVAEVCKSCQSSAGSVTAELQTSSGVNISRKTASRELREAGPVVVVQVTRSFCLHREFLPDWRIKGLNAKDVFVE